MFLEKLKIELYNPLLPIYSKEFKTGFLKYICHSMFTTVKKCKTTQMPIDRWMD